MRVFVTGATGFIGSAVVRELLEAGHPVVGLARSDRAAAALTTAGAEVHRGALDDLDSLAAGAAAADGVAHLAYVHDFADMATSGEIDLRAVEAIGAALAGSDRPFVVTSGTLVAPGRLATEVDEPDPASGGGHRVPAENAAVALAERGVRSSVVRLPPSVHGPGDHGFVPALVDAARETGSAVYVGDGANRWPAVHRLDAARLFRLALESAPAGRRLHGVGEEGVPFRDIAAAIGRALDLPLVSVTADEAADRLGWIGALTALDVPASSAATQQLLDWHPGQPGLVEDLDAGHYTRDRVRVSGPASGR